jgi:hypothetical protein
MFAPVPGYVLLLYGLSRETNTDCLRLPLIRSIYRRPLWLSHHRSERFEADISARCHDIAACISFAMITRTVGQTASRSHGLCIKTSARLVTRKPLSSIAQQKAHKSLACRTGEEFLTRLVNNC